MVLVNLEKEARAKHILAMVNGMPPKTEDEQETVKKFLSLFANENVDPKSKEALEFVYVKLGGLVRSETEHKKVQAMLQAIKSKMSGRKDE